MDNAIDKKLVVFLFPSPVFINIQNKFFKEEFDENFEISSVFDSIIQKRYLDKGYEFAIVNYIDKPVAGITINPDKIILTNLSQDEYYLDNEKLKERYLELAKQLDPKQYSEIRVGGYHLGDCVDKFTDAINSINPVASIDMQLTNFFANSVFNLSTKKYNTDYEFYEEIQLRNSSTNNHSVKL